MNKIWKAFYNVLIIPVLHILFVVLAPFNKKIKKGMLDRTRLFEKLIISLTGLDRSKKMVWFHSASLGEFEQAKPIIQKLKANKNINLIVTFFSPSGYDNSLKYPYADIVSYIPFDNPSLAKRFINLVRPDLVVFMRYDVWPNCVWQLSKKSVPVFIVDATMRKSSFRKLPVAKGFHKALYKNITKILTVSEEDKTNFLDFDIPEEKVRSVGDTRFDRVQQKCLQAKEKKLFDEKLLSGKSVFVFGSSWESDEEVILPAFEKVLQYDSSAVMILVPHEPSELRLEKLEHHFHPNIQTIRFSYMNNYNNEKVIIVDSIGILLTLYYYASFAYVGGSFKQGIHNVLEPAVYGIPVIYGPKIENSQEAQKLMSIGSGLQIKNKKEAYRTLRKLFADPLYRQSLGEISNDYVKSNLGATEQILKEIYKYL